MLLEVEDLSVQYAAAHGTLSAVDRVSFQLERGETLGLVGESGCGKSSLGKAIVRLTEATRGQVRLEGRDLLTLSRRELVPVRRRLQMVFQDPLSALDPRKTIRRTLTLPLDVHRIGTLAERRERVDALMHQVGLSPSLGDRLPHEFSGGQRQRANIARALTLDPQLIVCDEPVSALDVSLQAQVLNLLRDLQQRLGIAYLFISHDLAAVGHMADRIAVMYLGQVVELLPRERLWQGSAHPYTQLLIASVPARDAVRAPVGMGELPSPFSLPAGCRFQGRCPHVMPTCREAAPAVVELAPGHTVACHLFSSQGPQT